MNERINELRKQVKIDIHLHNIEDIKAMEGCFGFEGGNKIVNDYIEKFAELIVEECRYVMDCNKGSDQHTEWNRALFETSEKIKEHFGVEE